jgi:hypothetical protein
MRILFTLLLAAGSLAAEDPLTGYRMPAAQYEGPGEWRRSLEPVWVYEYPTLRLVYRATGFGAGDDVVLSLRPGSVGPVTPGATNVENPFVAGMPVAAVLARNLVADGARHTLEIDLKGKMRTPQIDQLRFLLPQGARLAVEELEFRGGADVLPCAAGGPALPKGAAKLRAEGGAECAGARATSMRGRESIRIRAGRAGRTLYLSLYPHFANVRAFAAGGAPDRIRVPESTETRDAIVRLRYADGFEEEQYPLSVDERRHTLLNRKPGLYAIELDPRRKLASAELVDRSLHAQLVLFAAGITRAAAPEAKDELPPAPRKPNGRGPAPDLSASTWYRTTAAAGAVRAELKQESDAAGRRLSLEVRNTSAQEQQFTLTFPALSVQPAASASDVYYVFPRQGAVIGRAELKLEAAYNAAFPLQFLDVFAPAANRGACLIVLDNRGVGKKFRVEKRGAAVAVEVDYAVRLAPGESFRPPDARIANHGGDWREGFDAYRQWVAGWYKPAGPRPAWLRTAFMARRDYPVGGTGLLFDVRAGRYTYDALLRDGQAFGGVDFIDISGWALSEKSGRVGDYPIELGGAADLRRNAEAAAQRGVPTGLYFEGYLIDKNSNVGKAHGAAWQLIDEKGQGAWWQGGSPELFVCPYVREWQEYLSRRVTEVARQTGASGVYLDEFGFGRKRCYSTAHGHARGVETLPGEIAMTRAVRRALDAAGLSRVMIYIEETPPDAAAPNFDAAFCYNFVHADLRQSPLKLNLSRFAFPDIRLWDMVTLGIDPRVFSFEDCRLSLWHGNGLWLKGHSGTWYGDALLEWMRGSRATLHRYAEAFAGASDPLVESPHPAVFLNRFTGGGRTVYTLFNASYRTARFAFAGRERALAPRDVLVIGPGE